MQLNFQMKVLRMLIKKKLNSFMRFGKDNTLPHSIQTMLDY